MPHRPIKERKHPGGRRGCSLVLALALSLAVATPLMAAMDRELFDERLKRAAQLNIEAPWPASQAVLEELRPHLDLADDDQHFRFMMLESRNQAIDGRLLESLETVEALLARDLDPEQRLAAHARAANVGYVAREFETTFRHLSAALELLEDPDLDLLAVNLYSVAAYIYVLLGVNEDATAFGRKAVEIAHREARPARERCAAHQRMAFVHKRIGDVEAAEREYLAAMDDCKDSGDVLVTGTVEYGYGDLLQMVGRSDEAETVLDRAIGIMSEQGYRSGLALSRLYRARLALATEDRVLARTLLEQALPDLRLDGNMEYVAEAHRRLSEIAIEEERQSDALGHLLESITAREAYLEQLHDRRTAFLQVQFAVADTERELSRLQEQQRIAELEQQSLAQRAQFRLFAALASLVLFLALLLILVRAVRDRRRYLRLSQRDPLTALSNHTRFFDLAETTLSLARRKGRPFTLVLADIDHFKAVNDRYGHPAGDQVLRQVGEQLRRSLGKVAILGRVGGEEFAMALPGVDASETRRRIEQLRCDLVAIHAEGVRVPITMSFGLATARADEPLADLRARADHRLYHAKRCGRDRVVDEDPSE